jgi:hypothetical protein
MNGANAEPEANTINTPKRRRIISIGASHHFLRSLKNAHRSVKIESLFIAQFIIMK